jgi:hypothetical protein
LIAPEGFLACRVSDDVCVRCVHPRHAHVRSPADFAPRMRALCLSDRHHRKDQKRSHGLPSHVLIPEHSAPTSKTKSKPHRRDRVCRKR